MSATKWRDRTEALSFSSFFQDSGREVSTTDEDKQKDTHRFFSAVACYAFSELIEFTVRFHTIKNIDKTRGWDMMSTLLFVLSGALGYVYRRWIYFELVSPVLKASGLQMRLV